jgi:hypothetical protein
VPKSLAAQLKLKTEPKKKRKDANLEVKLGGGYVQPELVDSSRYLAEPGDWEEENLIYTFKDGWTINECLSVYDVKLVGFLSLTCVSSYPVRNPKLTVKEERKVQLGKSVQRIERMYENDTWMSKSEKERRMKQALASLKVGEMAIPAMRIFRLTDTEQRPRCMILTVLDEALNFEGYNPEHRVGPPLQTKAGWAHASYHQKRDLGCQSPFEVSGQLLHLCEARIGTGASIPEVAVPYILEWYKASIQGEWDQALYDNALRTRWAALPSTRPARN